MIVLITEDPGKSINVYLRSLVDELKDLWTNGVCTYDKSTGKIFTLWAAVMCTVNDFPAYAMVFRWLQRDHKWRENDKEFDGNTEHRLRPRECSDDEILEQLNRLDFASFGKTKNVFDTLMGKIKDTIKACLDLERMGIRRGLWMNKDSDKARRDLAFFFSMRLNDKKDFLKFVSSVKFPDGYASNIGCCVNVDRAKTLQKTDINQLCYDIVQVLCKFEIIFPSAFFTSMIHVMAHLPEEALLAGPVNYRWMYPIERLLGELKKTVRNRAKPE
ncbi:hypothetical protein L3X38_033620 [Prunus dulcis]|uniref:DUF4218 domain-containing protein n=1 Tax=Prunus dulcis TaxID=3755 RepID=A0AAD4YW37_PRUDU|nr:hypothetical protein L3X38_033620 [Prunus dulcis]